MKQQAALLLCLLLSACASVALPGPVPAVAPLNQPAAHASRAWPVVAPLPAPQGLRPCCAFGYNLRAKLFGIAVPWYQLDNVLAADNGGDHHYNDNPLSMLATLSGLNGEHNGLIYTRRGGFIDLSHLRDSADNTLWLFSHIWPRLGEAFTLRLDAELGERRVQLLAFTPPDGEVARYNLAVALAAHIAFEIAAWHEIAQWYGFESVPGYPEGVSAFSPEDLYSNLLGTRIAIDILNAGAGSSLAQYQRAVTAAIPQALRQLEAASPSMTRFQFDMLDGRWWNSRCRLPDKYLLRYRNYDVSTRRLPSRPPETVSAIRLALPERFAGGDLSRFGRLEIWPVNIPTRLPESRTVFYFSAFPALADSAEKSDRSDLFSSPNRCQ